MKPLALFVSLLLALLLQPRPAWADAEPYHVVFDGPFASLTEEGADFFAHMDGFRPGQTQTGAFTCENRTDGPVTISVKLVPRGNALAGALSTEIRRGNLEGETVGHLSMNQQEEVALCRLESGQSASFAFLATVSGAIDARDGIKTGLAEWEFMATAKAAQNDHPTTGSTIEEEPASRGDGPAHGLLPVTGDSPVVLLLPAIAAASLAIALAARKRSA